MTYYNFTTDEVLTSPPGKVRYNSQKPASARLLVLTSPPGKVRYNAMKPSVEKAEVLTSPPGKVRYNYSNDDAKFF